MKHSAREHWVRGERHQFGWEQRLDESNPNYQRILCCYFWLVGWDCISFGLHVAIMQPNIEIHLPFGFIRIGWIKRRPPQESDYVIGL